MIAIQFLKELSEYCLKINVYVKTRNSVFSKKKLINQSIKFKISKYK